MMVPVLDSAWALSLLWRGGNWACSPVSNLCLRCRTAHSEPHDAPLGWLISETCVFRRACAAMLLQT